MSVRDVESDVVSELLVDGDAESVGLIDNDAEVLMEVVGVCEKLKLSELDRVALSLLESVAVSVGDNECVTELDDVSEPESDVEGD